MTTPGPMLRPASATGEGGPSGADTQPWAEDAMAFACGADTLIGVLAEPASAMPASEVGVLVIVGGPQYRAGSHRQFVQLARSLAGQGVPTLRFDYRGMGDSQGEARDFQAIEDDIAAAIDAWLRVRPALRRVALWGLCDGASAALMYCAARRDPRVAGLCLLNPWVRSVASQAKTQVKHYYRDRLMQKAFWVKLLSGRVAAGALAGLWRSLKAARGSTGAGAGGAAGFQQRMASGWRGFDGSILVLLSGNDYTAREFEEHARSDASWRGLLSQPNVTLEAIAAADHTFSGETGRLQAERSTARWALGLGRPG